MLQITIKPRLTLGLFCNWSDEVKIYHDDIKFILEATINPNMADNYGTN